MAEPADPYTVALGGLWAVLRSEPEVIRRVKPQNMVTLTGGNRAPIKAEVQAADLPELRVILRGSQPNSIGSSGMTGETVVFEIQVSSGDQRLDAQHLPLRWAIFRAMRKSLAKTLDSLQWNGKSFIVQASASEVRDGWSEEDLNRGIKGWASIWTCPLTMAFATGDL